MIIESIIFAIFLVSLAGVLFVLYKKLPVLSSLPKNGTTGIKEHHYFLHVEKKVKDFFLFFEKQILLHKALSFIKVMVLKAETKIDHLLHKIRKNAQKIDKDKK